MYIWYGIMVHMLDTNKHATPTRKVTMNLPVDLIEKAPKFLGKANLTEAVRHALREEIHRQGCRELLALRGKVKFKYSWQELRAMDDEE